MQILVSAIFFLIMVFLMSLVWTNSRGAPWVPTSRQVIRRMLDMAELKPGEVVYDLGCGDGRVLVTAARHFGACAVGVEVDWSRYLWSVLAVTIRGLWSRVRIIRGDLFSVDLHDADVVFTFLLQDTNDRLKEKLRRELRPGARIVSNIFTFSGFPLVSADEELHLYLYRVARPVGGEGSWAP
jgi:SAM-dependent methyltransferase